MTPAWILTRGAAVPVLCALLVLLAARHADAQAPSSSELVLYKERTKEYHRAGCPVVRDLAGVVAMTRAQAESRGYKAHPGCDPANPDAPTPKGAPPPPATVYLDGSKYYHLKTCPRLGDGSKLKGESLEVAGRSHWPCPDCKPPVRRKSTENAVPGTKRPKKGS